MEDVIELRFRYTEAEYLTAYRKYFLAKKRAFFMLSMSTGLVVVGVYFLISGRDIALTISFIGTGALLFGLLISSSILLPKQRFRTDPRFRGEYLLRFSDNGVEFYTKEIESKVTWRVYKEALETKAFFLLSDGGAILTVVPKRAFANADDESRFRELLDRNI